MNLRSLLTTALYRCTGWVHGDFPGALASKWLELTSLRRFLEKHGINVVLDVGANEGQFAAKLRRLGFTGRIVSFEPDPRVYSRLVERHGHDPAWRSYPLGLGDADTELTFHLASNSVLSSFLTSVKPSNMCSEVHVPVRRLDGMLPEILDGIPDPHIFLKTDTQGYDLQVLRGASGCLEQLIGIIAEISVIPIYEQSPPFHEAIREYRDAGFDMVDLSLENRTIDGRVLELNGLFVRRGLVS